MRAVTPALRFFLTGLVLGIVLAVFTVRINPFILLRTPQPVNAVAGTLTISGSDTTVTGDVTAARIVDSANSAYFIDPAAAGTSLSLAGNASVSGTMTMASNQPFRPAFGPVKLDYKSGPDTYATGLIIQDTTGNVGIGTTTPAQKLSVAGTVESTTGGFKFPDGSTQTAAASGDTSGQIAFFATACPSGWTEYTALRGRAVVGTPLSGTNAGTVGTAYSNLEDRTHTHAVDPASTATDSQGAHTHTGPSHTHAQNSAGGTGYVPGAGNIFATSNSGAPLIYTTDLGGSSPVMQSGVQASGTGATSSNGAHTHSVDIASTTSTATSATPPYIQLTACQKN